MSCLKRSASDVHPANPRPLPSFVRAPPSRGGDGAGRMDRVMLSPAGFFLDTEEDLRDGNDEEGVVDPASETDAMDFAAVVGRRGDTGISAMTRATIPDSTEPS